MKVTIDGVEYVPAPIRAVGHWSLAEALAAARKRLGCTLDDAAETTGISKTYLHDLETGKATEPSFRMVIRLCEVYRIGVSTLMDTRDFR